MHNGRLGLWRVGSLAALGGALILAACGASAPPAPETEADGSGPAPAEQEALPLPHDLGEPVARIEIDMPAEPRERNGMFSAPPPRVLEATQVYYAVLRTARGDVTVQLFADRTPVTVNNFVYLALTGYFDGTTFHRVLADFMAQGGDPTGTGTGGPGYNFPDEFVANLNFDRSGLLAMANAGPGTNGSQFFITFAPTTHLNQRHTIFGEVIDGMDAVRALALRDPQRAAAPGDALRAVDIYAHTESVLPAPAPTPTPTPAPTPYAPHQALTETDARPLAALAPAQRIGYFNTPPERIIDLDRAHTAVVETSEGALTFALRTQAVPDGVNNFVVLARLGYFDDVRVLPAQDGRFSLFGILDGTRNGVVGYSLPAEPGYEGEEAGPGLLAYLRDWDDPTQVLGGALFVTHEAEEPSILAQLHVIGTLTAGHEVLARLRGRDDARILTVNAAASE